MRTIDTRTADAETLARWLGAVGVPVGRVPAQVIDVDDMQTGALVDVTREGKPGTQVVVVHLAPGQEPDRWGLGGP